jgi:hypothetical protein
MVFDINKRAPHDRSIFRKHVGRALLKRDKSEYLKIWDLDFTTPAIRESYQNLRNIQIEIDVELEVTRILRDTFSFRYIEIQGEKDRIGENGLEKALIGTLAQCSCCTSSLNWLGRHSPSPRIFMGHLWLIQHLRASPLTKQQLQAILVAI